METTDVSTGSAQLNAAEWVYRLLAHIKDDSFTLPGCRHLSFFSVFPILPSAGRERRYMCLMNTSFF
jgi:hypothetical protein